MQCISNHYTGTTNGADSLQVYLYLPRSCLDFDLQNRRLLLHWHSCNSAQHADVCTTSTYPFSTYAINLTQQCKNECFLASSWRPIEQSVRAISGGNLRQSVSLILGTHVLTSIAVNNFDYLHHLQAC